MDWVYRLSAGQVKQGYLTILFSDEAAGRADLLLKPRWADEVHSDLPKFVVSQSGYGFGEIFPLVRTEAGMELRVIMPELYAKGSYSWKAGRIPALSLSAALLSLRVSDLLDHRNMPSKQLLCADSMYDPSREMHGCAFAADIYQPLILWLAQHELPREQVALAMANAFWTMGGPKRLYASAREFRALGGDGRFVLQCPLGNCACFGVDGMSRSDDKHWRVGSHNTDNVLQQFTLLAGLAAICDQAAKDLNLP